MVKESNVLSFFVNGSRCKIENPSTSLTLLTYIRDELGLKGTKFACGEGGCGACTVTLSRYDPQTKRVIHSAINACITMVCSLHGCAITTVEGLGSVEKGLHPVQERIFKAHGSQCGFCTPGMVMSMSSLLRNNNEPEVDDVELALQGNLCRCTGYRPIVEGFQTLCKTRKEKEVNDVNHVSNADGSMEVRMSDLSDSKPYSKTCDPEFPADLRSSDSWYNQNLAFKPLSGIPWYMPVSVDQVKEIRKKYRKVQYYAGGTGSFKVPEIVKPDAVIQITYLEALQGVRKDSDGVSIGAGITMTKLLDVCEKVSTSVDETKNGVLKLLARVLKTWVSSQIRNVATIGGHIMWSHPCSDLIPILMAAGATIEVLTMNGVKKTVLIDESFYPKAFQSALGQGDLILELKIPFTRPDERVFYYRRARRKDFDLPIANAAFMATVSGDKVQKLRAVAGGMEGAFPGAKASPAKFIKSTTGYLLGKNANSFDKKDLAEKVFDDISVEERAPGQLSNYRRCLVAVFAERFLNDLEGRTEISIGEQRKAIRAHQLFEKVDPDQKPEDAIFRPVPHQWAAEQATGEAVYINDMRKQEGELQLLVVQSQRSKAKVKNIDFNEAMKVPGVVGYLTSDDIPANGEKKFGSMAHDEDVLASEQVLYYGQIIAALLCTDVTAGKQARKLVKVTYEDDPDSVISIHNLKNPDDESNFLGPKLCIERDQGVEPVGKVRTVKGSVTLGGQEHFYLEPSCSYIVPTGEKNELLVYANTQSPTTVQKEICSILNLPQSKVVVKTKRVGGAFGGKERSQLSLIAALAAHKFKRPIRAVLSRAEDIATTGQRHNITLSYSAEVDEVGKIVKFEVDCNINGGCSMDLTVFWALSVLFRIDGGYTMKNFKGVARSLRTNSVSNTAFRGFGGPEAQIVIETIMDHIAHNLNMDVMKLKEVNLTREGDQLHYGDNTIAGVTLEECWKECLKFSKYKEKRKDVNDFNAKNKVIKRGLAVTPIKFAVSLVVKMMNQGGALVMIYTDGTVLVATGGVEMGQGLNTKLTQIVTHELSVPLSKVNIMCTSTETVPNTMPTAGSTGTDLNGAAVLNACKQLTERLAPFRKAHPDWTWEQVVGAAHAETVNLTAFGFYGNSPMNFDFTTMKGVPFHYLTYGAGCTEVEVNCHTGDVTVLSANIVMDLGKSLNPAIDIGQIEGAYVQGLGYCTTEQLLMDARTGELLTTGPGTYKIPTVNDIPREMNVMLLKQPKSGQSVASPVYSSKGVGEPPLLVAAGGIVSAVREAITSYRRDQGAANTWVKLDHVPLTVDKVRMAAVDEYTEAMTSRATETSKMAVEK